LRCCSTTHLFVAAIAAAAVQKINFYLRKIIMKNYATNLSENASTLVDSAAQTAEHMVRSSQKVANHTLDQITDTVNDARVQTGTAFNRLATDAEKLTRRGLNAVRDESLHLRDQSRHAVDSTVGYIKDEPLKSVLIAAAVGAGLMALVTLVSHTSGSRH
jgi:ElaB/YqjD/DUF883 family membrane-anchored ribosome-binding protein